MATVPDPLIAPPGYTGVPFSEIVPLSMLAACLPKGPTGKAPAPSTVFAAVAMGRLPSVVHMGRRYSHPLWCAEAALNGVEGQPHPLPAPSRRRQLASVDRELDRRLGKLTA